MRVRTGREWVDAGPSGYRPPHGWVGSAGGGYRLGDLAPAAARNANLYISSAEAGGPRCVYGHSIEVDGSKRRCACFSTPKTARHAKRLTKEQRLARRRAYARAWRESRAEHLKAYRAAWTSGRREKIAATNRQYRLAHLEEIRAKDRVRKREWRAKRRAERD